MAQRASGNDSYQQLRVNMRGATSTKRFVWSGNTIAEERDSTGANVTKRFFAEGEQRAGTPVVNYYYSRDHLGSIREVTTSNGAQRGQYDYDAWGNQTAFEGKVSVDFGYTGHYFHQPSGLNLTMYRAYSPSLGRWLSRDPVGEQAGLNLYEYVNDNPIRWTDPRGLSPEERIPPGNRIPPPSIQIPDYPLPQTTAGGLPNGGLPNAAAAFGLGASGLLDSLENYYHGKGAASCASMSPPTPFFQCPKKCCVIEIYFRPFGGGQAGYSIPFSGSGIVVNKSCADARADDAKGFAAIRPAYSSMKSDYIPW